MKKLMLIIFIGVSSTAHAFPFQESTMEDEENIRTKTEIHVGDMTNIKTDYGITWNPNKDRMPAPLSGTVNNYYIEQRDTGFGLELKFTPPIEVKENESIGEKLNERLRSMGLEWVRK